MTDRSVSPPTAPAEDADGIFRALADPRRRQMLAVLRAGDERVWSTQELAAAVTRVESGADATPGDSPHVASSLHHSHLPRLDELGVLDYDPDDGTVRYRGDPDVEAALDAVDSIDP